MLAQPKKVEKALDCKVLFRSAAREISRGGCASRRVDDDLPMSYPGQAMLAAY